MSQSIPKKLNIIPRKDEFEDINEAEEKMDALFIVKELLPSQLYLDLCTKLTQQFYANDADKRKKARERLAFTYVPPPYIPYNPESASNLSRTTIEDLYSDSE